MILSPHNAHRNAEVIYRVGADRKQLTNAVAVELAVEGPERVAHLTATEKLVKRAGGLLAPLNGEERYCTLGTGHTAAWCKLACIGGKTPAKSLQDEHGQIDVGKVKKNAEFKIMLEKGWQWEIVKSFIDTDFPKFAPIAQKALNTQNHVSTEVGEIETAVTLAESAYELEGEPDWEELAVENVKALCVPCAHYAKTILDFCVLYGGGHGAPHIKFLDNVAKAFGANVNLGETFWQTITSLTFPSKTSKLPLLRVAIALANLTSDKREDGIAKLLAKSDLVKLTSKKMLDTVMGCETVLKEALEIADALAANYPKIIDEDAVLGVKGKLFVRVALSATGKGKSGREGKQYALEQIKDMYLTAMSGVLGMKVEFDTWSATASSANSEPQPAEPAEKKSKIATLLDHSNPSWIAEQSGFEVGGNVAEKC